MKRRILLVPTLLACMALIQATTQCGFLDDATRTRTNADQKRSVIDIVLMLVAIATVFDDPENLTNQDAMLTMDNRPMVAMGASICVDGDAVAAPSSSPGLKNAAGDSCVTTNANGRLVMTDCVVKAQNNATCLFNVDGTKEETFASASGGAINDAGIGTLSDGGSLGPDADPVPGLPDAFNEPGPEAISTHYAGSIRMSGPSPCPQVDLIIDFVMEGPSDAPTGLNGECRFSTNDGMLNVYDGSLRFENVGLAPSCDKLSLGRFLLLFNGLYWGQQVDTEVAFDFLEDPCGDIRLGGAGATNNCELPAPNITPIPLYGDPSVTADHVVGTTTCPQLLGQYHAENNSESPSTFAASFDSSSTLPVTLQANGQDTAFGDPFSVDLQPGESVDVDMFFDCSQSTAGSLSSKVDFTHTGVIGDASTVMPGESTLNLNITQ